MSARPMHQPPNPDDMRRQPPATPDCARVRAKLRDYADGDLPMVEVASVDEHIAGCRTCAVELARAEHEVLRLRRAFEEIRGEQEADPAMTLRSDFAARVVEQLVLTDAIDRSGEDSGKERAAGAAGARRGAAGHVVASNDPSDERGSDERGSNERGRRERGLSFASPAGALVSGLCALFVIVIGARLLDWPVGKPSPSGKLVIQHADDCFDANRRQLTGGDTLLEGGSVWVQRHGGATMEWHDWSERAQPAATIEIQDGELQFKDGAPILVGGRVVVETNRGVVIPMADGSRLQLGMGEYVIAAIPTDMIEDGGYDPQESAWGTSGDVRIEVEVRNGDEATILRSGASTGIVAAGTTAQYQGGGMIDISPTMSPLGGGRIGSDRAPLPPPVENVSTLLVGHVLGPSGQPSVGASVGVTYIADEKEYSDFQATGANGAFSLVTSHPCDTAFGVAFSIPNSQRSDLGMVAPDAVPLLLHGELAQLERPLSIGYSTGVSGIVSDDLGAPRFGVQVVPLIIDELFGSVYALDFKKVVTAPNGRFQVDQLPSYLPHHQRLAMLLTHDQLETTVVSVPIRGSALAPLENQSFVMSRLQTVGLYSMPASSTVTVLEEIRGLPRGVAVVRRTVQSNAVGFVPELKIGSGRLWFLSNGSTPRLKQLHGQSLGAFVLMYPSSNWVDYDDVLRPMQQLVGTEVQLQNAIRHQNVQVDEIENIVSSPALRVTDAAHKNVQRAQVFALAQTGLDGYPRTRFLGFTGDNGVLSLGAVKNNEDVFVIGPGGATAHVSRPMSFATLAAPLVLQVKSTGSVLLAEDLRPAPSSPDRFVTVRFRRLESEVLDGMEPESVRFVTDGYWDMSDLPAGSYVATVRGVQYPVVVPSSGFVTLSGQ